VAVFCRCILDEDRPKYSDPIQQSNTAITTAIQYSDPIQQLIHVWNGPELNVECQTVENRQTHSL
jgi:hypothetical protein